MQFAGQFVLCLSKEHVWPLYLLFLIQKDSCRRLCYRHQNDGLLSSQFSLSAGRKALHFANR